MGLVDDYKATLKPLAVEEPIDVFWHRLAGYAIARGAYPTPVSADAITVFAILMGVLAGAAIAAPFAKHMLVAAVLLELSAAFDCADGQLARMRKRSSEFGRMLDGVSDSIVMAATFLGTMIHFALIGAPAWMIFLAAIAAPTCSFHFAWYDHYKNIYLRMTGSSFREGEDPESARARYAAFGTGSFVLRFVWWVYLRYVSGQAWLLRWSDPHSRYDRAPRTVPAAIGPMRVWRSLYGLGTHIFLFSIACAFDRIDLYLIFRVGVLNVFAFGVLLPWQRLVSKQMFRTVRAVILAAGTGTRLRPSTADRPKAMLTVAGEPLLVRLSRQLRAVGVNELVIATGHGEASVRAAGLDASFFRNDDYATTQNVVSLNACSAALAPAETWKLDGDLFVEDAFIERMAAAELADDEMLCAIDRRGDLGTEEMKVALSGERIVRFGKGLSEAHGESAGIERIGSRALSVIVHAVGRAVTQGETQLYYEDVYDRVLKDVRARAIDVGDLAWTEIDTAEDLARAEAIARELAT